MREEQEALFNALRSRLIRASRGYLRDLAGEAEDLVQDAFMLAGHRLDPAAPPAATAAWMQQVCLQLCGARLRDRDGIVRCLEAELERVRKSQAVERVASDNLVVQKQQWIGLLREAIKPLSLSGRQALQLRNVKGLSYGEIGATLSLSWSGVAARLGAAREELRSLLGPEPAQGVLTRGPW